jgi:hypothetical protein
MAFFMLPFAVPKGKIQYKHKTKSEQDMIDWEKEQSFLGKMCWCCRCCQTRPPPNDDDDEAWAEDDNGKRKKKTNKGPTQHRHIRRLFKLLLIDILAFVLAFGLLAGLVLVKGPNKQWGSLDSWKGTDNRKREKRRGD